MTQPAIDFKTLQTEVTAFKEEFEALQAKYQEKMQGKIQQLLQAYFTFDTECKMIHWRQYTPYFNDGEPCEFSVHEPEFFGKGVDSDGEETDDPNEIDFDESYDHQLPESNSNGQVYEGYISGKGAQYRPATEIEKARHALSQIISADSLEETLRYAFGDHVEVIVTANGIEAREYDHD
jgi:hypothetical protein